MITVKPDSVERVRIESLDYKGKSAQVKDVAVQWLSKSGTDAQGSPAYGLRLFTTGPGGVIPTHSHLYMQTMYILSGRFECWQADPDTDEITERSVVGPGQAVFVPSMEPHGMRNMSAVEPATFLCCIGSVDEEGNVTGICA
ncbi:MAG: cupin domain-containing protein [Pseudomonadota bacterium]